MLKLLRDRMLDGLGGLRRPRGSARLIRRAEELRREGRYEEAGESVALALRESPHHVLGHLLRSLLYVACRNTEAAKLAFAHVLALDPHQPRALLGLARLAFEEGDSWSCREFLNRALRLFPDFPEAAALFEAVGSTVAEATPPGRPHTTGARSLLRRTPAQGRDLVVSGSEGALYFSETENDRAVDVARHTAQVQRITTSVLSRVGLGVLIESVIEYGEETTFTRTGEGETLSVTFPRAMEEPKRGALALDNLWQDTASLRIPA